MEALEGRGHAERARRDRRDSNQGIHSSCMVPVLRSWPAACRARPPIGRPARRYHAPVPMRVAFLAAECEPWAKTGGLADVVDALARALGAVAGDALELPVDVFLPRYRSVAVPAAAITGERTVRGSSMPERRTARTSRCASSMSRPTATGCGSSITRLPSIATAGTTATRAGTTRTTPGGSGCSAAPRWPSLEAEGRPPDVLHLHDWHASPAVRYAAPGPGGPATLLTVHNLAYHGWTPTGRVAELGVEWTSALLPSAPGIDLLGEGIAARGPRQHGEPRLRRRGAHARVRHGP